MCSKLESGAKGAIDFFPIICWHTKTEKNGLSIIKQAERAAKQIINVLKGLPDKGKNIKVVLMGYSQGGLRGTEVFKMLKGKGYKVVCFLTFATPWQGSGIVGKGRIAGWKGQGVRDLSPGGDFIKGIKGFLQKRQTTKDLPIMFIGGKSSFKKFDENGEKVKYDVPARVSRGCLHNQTMIRSFKHFLGKNTKYCVDTFTFSPLLLPGPLLSPTLTRGHSKRKMPEGPPIKSVREHDSVVSLASQLAKNLLPDGVFPDNWGRVAVEGCHHGSFGKDKVTGRPILEHPEAHEVAATFIIKCLNQSKKTQPDTEGTRP